MNVKALVSCCIVAIAGHTVADDVVLLWSNGDSLPGKWKALDGNAILWDSPLFPETVVVGTDSLRGISFPAADTLVEVSEPFRADTGSGEIIYGKLVAIDDAEVSLQSERHGTVALKRSELVSLRRLSNSAFISLAGLRGWKTLDPDRAVAAWRRGSRGSVSTDRRNGELFQRVDFPERAEVELVISWQQTPGFVFSIIEATEIRSPNSVTVETWDDEVVLVAGNRFEPVRSLSDAKGRLHLRIYVDREAGEVTVYSHEGRQLAQISDIPAGDDAKRGVYLRNKRSDLALESLRISRWNGQLPVPLSPGENRLHLIDGELVYGVVKAYDGDAKSIVVEENDQQSTFKVEQVDTIYFAAKERSVSGDQVEVSFHDGAVVRGKLESLEGNEVVVRTASAEQAVTCRLNDCRDIHWPTEEQTPPDSGDVLYWTQGRSHGEVAAVDRDGFPVGWRVTGSETAVPLDESQALRLVRRDVKTSASQLPKFPDAIYLNDFTSLPCRVTEVDEMGARVATPFNSDPVIVQHDLLKALEFRRPRAIEGFEDKRWNVASNENVKLDAKQARFTNAGRLSHPAALIGSEVRFKMKWDSQCRFQMQLRLFAESVGSAGPSVTCMMSGGSSYLNFAGGDGRYRRAAQVKSSTADFRIVCRADQMVVEVNGESVLEESLVQGRPGRGIEFIVASLTNNRGRPGGSVTISDFSAKVAAGDSSVFVPLAVKEKVLTVPRLIQSNPPRHILAAPNGDVLRGELISVDSETAVFRSKLRDLNVPRERVAGIVWLHEEKSVPVRSGNTRVMLAEDRILAFDPSTFHDDALIGRSSVFGEATIPINRIREIHLGDYEPPKALAPYEDWQLRNAKASP